MPASQSERFARKLLDSLKRSLGAQVSLDSALTDPWMDLPWTMPYGEKLLVADAMERLEDYKAVMAEGQRQHGARLEKLGKLPFAEQWQRAELEAQLREAGEEF